MVGCILGNALSMDHRLKSTCDLASQWQTVHYLGSPTEASDFDTVRKMGQPRRWFCRLGSRDTAGDTTYSLNGALKNELSCK